MHFRVSHQSQCGLYQRTNQIVCQKIRVVSTLIWRHVSLLYVVQSNILWLTILLIIIIIIIIIIKTLFYEGNTK